MMNLSGLSEIDFSASLIFGARRRELIVDDYDAVVAGRDADISSGTGEHVHRARDFLDLDLHLAEILLGEGRGGGESCEDDHQFTHDAGL